MSDLVDRYVWAVARGLPEDSRDDIVRELRATVADMLEARGRDDDGAVREVLIELGDPSALAARYAGARPCLVGPELYPSYVKLLKTLLLIVAPIVFVATFITGLWDAERGAALGVLGAAGAAFQIGAMIVFWVTLVFFVLERKGDRRDTRGAAERAAWDPDSLPSPAPPRQIRLRETIASLAALTLLVAWIPWQRSHSVEGLFLGYQWMDADGEPVRFLDQGLWEFWIPAFVVVVAISMGIEVWKYVAGRWTLPLVVANLGANALFAGVVVAALRTEQIVDPLFLSTFRDRTGEAFPSEVVGMALALLVVGLCVWDSIDCVVKHLRLRRAAGPAQSAAADA